ncbi:MULTISPECIES: hypothetical protein [Thauera]|uniref:Uncharacterized protein n=1 Tax=Thauera propionica TaxID=2019431 RepID=A0A235F2B6_9RHOO|nr:MULTISPECIES: hypothetical protein [Thauera]OYD55408.1 hypothetical protein CGK74_04265 [Thauera propionica]
MLPAATKTKKCSTNPFKGYQDKVVAEREQIIVRYLASLRKTRAKFEYVTDLAKAVAEQVELAEGRPCSFTTLLRNKRYKALLLNFMAIRSRTDAVQVSDPAAQALIHTVELELGNVKRDNDRLRAYIADLEVRLSEHPALSSSTTQRSESADELSRLSNEKALACKALWLVLEHFKDLVSIDADRGSIIDLAASKRKNVIVEPEIARVFLDWVRANSKVGN